MTTRADMERDTYSAKCNGAIRCQADTHIHGCFRDQGNCDDPDQHLAVAPEGHRPESRDGEHT